MVSAEKFTQIKFRHKSTLERADGVLVMCLGQHYIQLVSIYHFCHRLDVYCNRMDVVCARVVIFCHRTDLLSLTVIAPRRLHIATSQMYNATG